MSTIGSLSEKEITLVFSKERLDKLYEIYDVDGKGLVLIHEGLNDLSGAIFASLSVFEVQFRNIVSYQLSQMFINPWYEQGVFAETAANKATLKHKVSEAKARAHLNVFSKQSHLERRRLRIGTNGSRKNQNKHASRKLVITNGDLISHFYFSFWRTLFSKTFEPQLWNFGLRQLFPTKSITRGQVSENLEVIYKVRNRIAHHEFIHPKLCRSYLAAIKFLSKNLRLKGRIRVSKVYKFQEPYIKRIEYQLSQLEHILATLNTSTNP